MSSVWEGTTDREGELKMDEWTNFPVCYGPSAFSNNTPVQFQASVGKKEKEPGESLSLNRAESRNGEEEAKNPEFMFKFLLGELELVRLTPPSKRSLSEKNYLRRLGRKFKAMKAMFPEISVKLPSTAATMKKEADRARLSTEDARAATRARLATTKNKEATRKRMALEKNKDATRQRMAMEKNKAADRLRKAAKIVEKDKVEKRPQAPTVRYTLAMECESPGSGRSGKAIRPTCILGEELTLTIKVECFPAPTFIWRKDGKVIGKEVSGGTPLQRAMKAKEASPCPDNLDRLPLPKKLPKSWRKGRLGITSDWYHTTMGRCVNPRVGVEHKCEWDSGSCQYERVLARSATSTLKIYKTELGDAGSYSVQVTNLHGSWEHTFDNVDFTPTLVKDISASEVEVVAGTGSLQLDVEVSGGRVSWFKDGTEVKQLKHGEKAKPGDLQERNVNVRGLLRIVTKNKEVSSLRVCECKMDDAGTYIAKAKTDAGECTSSACVVTVVEKGKLK